MKNKTPIIVLSIVSLIVLAISVLIIIGKQYSPKYDWRETLSLKSDQPYGTKVFHDALNAEYGTEKFKLVKNNLTSVLNESPTNSLYFIVGHTAYYDSSLVESLFDYISEGNTAIIALNYFPKVLIDYLTNDSVFSFATDYQLDSIMHIELAKKPEEKFNFHFKWGKKLASYRWRYIRDSIVERIDVYNFTEQVSEYPSKGTNGLLIHKGDGQLILYSSPILFTNYYLLNNSGQNHAQHLLNYAGDPTNIYWDGASLARQFNTTGPDMSANPLKYVLSKESLRWAWYIGLISILLYIIFRAKRNQRIIPIVQANRNSSIEYAKAVGTLHYQKSDIRMLTTQLERLLYSFIKKRYNITCHSKDPFKSTQLIAEKSAIKADEIDQIFKLQYSIKYNPMVEKNVFINYYNKLENFYKNCK